MCFTPLYIISCLGLVFLPCWRIERVHYENRASLTTTRCQIAANYVNYAETWADVGAANRQWLNLQVVSQWQHITRRRTYATDDAIIQSSAPCHKQLQCRTSTPTPWPSPLLSAEEGSCSSGWDLLLGHISVTHSTNSALVITVYTRCSG